jgi:lysophospholipase L1-like esterase
MSLKRRTLAYPIVAALLVLQLSGIAAAQSGQEHWVATWASAQQAPRGGGGQRAAAPAPPAAAGQQAPAGPAAAAPRGGGQPAPASLKNQTVRMIVHTTIGGRRARVQLSNAFGAGDLNIGAAHIALRSKDSEIAPGTDKALLFNGKPTVTIPPGALMISDPLDINIPKSADLVVSIYVPGETGPLSQHTLGLHTTYISKEGDFTGQPSIADATTSNSWYWLANIDVMAPANAAAIVAFGDSITDGATSTPNTDRSWPSVLAERLLANSASANLSVVNQGISGNRVLGDGAGVSALARFDRDVISVAGVKWVMILESINDIGGGARGNPVTADALIGALKQLVERAHTHGIKVVGCTLTPFAGAGYFTENGETIRSAVNNWIRTGKAFDAVVDFDAATRDPNKPTEFRKDYNNTDHLHPNDAGYKAMADAVNLSIFTQPAGAVRR